MSRKKEQVARRRRRYGRPPARFSEAVRARSNSIFIDHAFFRLVHLNLHRIDEKALRSAQPWPHQIRKLARRGLRTIVNLRGQSEFGSYALELEAARDSGIVYRELKLQSRHPPSYETILEAKRLFDEIEYPALFHCKSGADRAGLLGVLYLLLHKNLPLEEARRQLHWRFGHFRQSKTGVLDRIFDEYGAAMEAARARGEDLSFLEWARTDYDPERIKREFRENNLYGVLVDRVLMRE